MLMKLHSLIERIAPPGTRRGRWYYLAIIGLNTIINEGFSSFWRKFMLYTFKRGSYPISPTVPLLEVDIPYSPLLESLDLTKELKITFTSKADKLREVRILTAAHRGSSDLELLVEVDGGLKRRAVLKGRYVLNDGYTSLKFKPINGCEGKNITLRLRSLGEPPTIVPLDRRIALKDIGLYYDGRRISGGIGLKLLYDVRGVNIYHLWIKKNEPDESRLREMREEAKRFEWRPKISIVTSTWDSEEEFLKKSIDSVLNQIYDNWELCVVDSIPIKPRIREILEEYSKGETRVKVKFLKENLGIAENLNEALKLATGEFVCFLDGCDELAPFALHEIVKLLNKNPALDFIYSDEDKIDEANVRKDPFFKPDYSPDMLLSYNYISRLVAIRKSLVDEVGGFRVGYDGAQDHDLFLRILEHTDKIAHIPKILYHRRIIPSSAALPDKAGPNACEAARKALTDAMRRRGIEVEGVYPTQPGSCRYRIKYKVVGDPKVSIIIPTRDKVKILKRCIDSILNKTTYQNYEIVIVDNDSEKRETWEYYTRISRDPRIKILEYRKPFNYSAINNYAVSMVDSEYVLFLNNDTEVISPEWLSAMLEHAQRKEVGAVGAKLLYPNGKIQHCGVILLRGGVAGHIFRHFPNPVNHNLAEVIRNFSAVTAACMLTKRSVFEEVGGFDEINLPVAFNDVDYCLKLREKGYLIVYTPYAILYHHEFLSRGYDVTPEKRERAAREVAFMRGKWAELLDNDPYYNPNLEGENCSIRI
ncbi:MAG: glycosyltransferase family 2 protein [Candidatus Korarchaeum sp.]